jgi:hypothetical protein
VALRVRPKDFDAPRIVGTLYVDATTADLVRLAFNFTPRAYLDAQLEDVSIVLDNAMWEGRFWLPYRQELEIRRRATWLDMPARGIIRARWEIDGYVFNLGLATSWFQGDEITFLPKAERDSFPWREPLAQAIQTVAEPVRQNDLERVRADVEQIAGRRALTGLKAHRLGVRGLSDLVRANRVEGLTVGAGLVWRGGGERRELRLTGSYGFSDRRPNGSVTATDREGRRALEVAVFREVRDVGDERVIAPLLNSFSSQEFAADYGDYYRADGARLTYRHGSGVRGEWSAALGRETIHSLAVTAEPASGTFRPNPALGDVGLALAQLAVRRRSEGFAVRRDLHYELVAEAGPDCSSAPKAAPRPATCRRIAASCSAAGARCWGTISASGAADAWRSPTSSGASGSPSSRSGSGPMPARRASSPSRRTWPRAGPVGRCRVHHGRRRPGRA